MTGRKKYDKQYDTGAQQSILFDFDDEIEGDSPDDSMSPTIEELNRESELQDSALAAQRAMTQTMRFISFGSGSSGNCSYVGTDEEGILVDAGVDQDHVFKWLADNGVTPGMVKGIIITHDHSDHVRYAYTIARHYKHIRIYCTNRVLNGILRRHSISHRIKDVHTAIFKEIPFTLAGLTITGFDVSHDGTDNAGFFIEHGTQRLVVATDMGTITDRARHYMTQADYLMIEANYDARMLELGHYPEYLKNRIRAANGHLDNKDAAEFVASMMSVADGVYKGDLKYVFLCHLSNDNNTPEKALAEVRSAIEAKGVTVGAGEGTLSDLAKDMQLVALPRFEPSRLFVLRK